ARGTRRATELYQSARVHTQYFAAGRRGGLRQSRAAARGPIRCGRDTADPSSAGWPVSGLGGGAHRGARRRSRSKDSSRRAESSRCVATGVEDAAGPLLKERFSSIRGGYLVVGNIILVRVRC